MQTAIQSNFLIAELSTGERLYAVKSSFLGFNGAPLSTGGADGKTKRLKRFSVQSFSTAGESTTLIFSGKMNNLCKITLSEEQSFRVAGSSLLAFSEDIAVSKVDRGFYSAGRADGLLRISGPGDVYLESTSETLIKLRMNDSKTNLFNADSIIMFDDSLGFKLKKISQTRYSVEFFGDGFIYLRG